MVLWSVWISLLQTRIERYCIVVVLMCIRYFELFELGRLGGIREFHVFSKGNRVVFNKLMVWFTFDGRLD